ncbi:MAG: hypothetical protein ACK55I_10870, partial [bacterium]
MSRPWGPDPRDRGAKRFTHICPVSSFGGSDFPFAGVMVSHIARALGAALGATSLVLMGAATAAAQRPTTLAGRSTVY